MFFPRRPSSRRSTSFQPLATQQTSTMTTTTASSLSQPPTSLPLLTCTLSISKLFPPYSNLMNTTIHRPKFKLSTTILCFLILLLISCAHAEDLSSTPSSVPINTPPEQIQRQSNLRQSEKNTNTNTVNEDNGYIAYIRGENLGNNQKEISVLINGDPTTDILLHNSTMVSFRIPSTIVNDKHLFKKSFVEISLSSKVLGRIPLTVLEKAISKVNLEEWKLSVTREQEQQTNNDNSNSNKNNNNNDDSNNDDKANNDINNEEIENANDETDDIKGSMYEKRQLINDEHNEFREQNEKSIDQAIKQLKINKHYSNSIALELLTDANSKGNITATTMLGSMYLSGRSGVKRDVKLAVEYLKQATEKGEPEAQALIGFLYASGYAVPYIPLDTGAALLYWRFAAEGGSNIARMALAFRYLKGMDVQENCPIAASLYREVAANVYSDLVQENSINNFNYSKSGKDSSDQNKNHQKQQQRQNNQGKNLDENEDYEGEVEGDEDEEHEDGEHGDEEHGDEEYEDDVNEDDVDEEAIEEENDDGDGADENVDLSNFEKEVDEEGNIIFHQKPNSETGSKPKELSGEEIDELTKAIQPPKGYSLHESERKHLTEERFQRVAGEKHDLVQFYRHNADRGEPQYQLLMGHLYYYGAADMRQDINEARKWFQEAAESGRSEAYSHLGYIDLKEGNYEDALKNLQIGASSDEKLGILGLGYLNLRGIGTVRNVEKAAKLFQKAATKKVPEAFYNLAILHENGIGVGKSQEKSIGMFAKAADFGHIQSHYRIALLLLDGSLKDGKKCPQAVEHLKLVSEQGIWSTVLVRALRAYEKGAYEDALFRYLFAAHAGIEVGQYNAAFMFEHSQVLNSNKFSLDTIRNAATLGNTIHTSKGNDRRFWMSLDEENDSDFESEGTDENKNDESKNEKEDGEEDLSKRERKAMIDQAMQLYQISALSASLLNNEALLRLGDLAYGEEKDYRRAALAYEQAIKYKNAEAMFNLGMMHARGFGMNSDKHIAKRYFDLAVETSPDEARIPAMIALAVLRYSDMLEKKWMDAINSWNQLKESILNMVTVQYVKIRSGGEVPEGHDQTQDGERHDRVEKWLPKTSGFVEDAGDVEQVRRVSVKAVLTPDIIAVTLLLAILVVVVNLRQRRLMHADVGGNENDTGDGNDIDHHREQNQLEEEGRRDEQQAIANDDREGSEGNDEPMEARNEAAR